MRNRFRRRLVVRLWLVVCVTVVPLILGTIILTGVQLGSMWKRQWELRQRELNLAMASFGNGLEWMETRMDELMQNYMTPLTVPSGTDTMVSYEMAGELERIQKEASLQGLVSVLERESKKLYIKFTPDTYEIQEAEQIRKALEQSIFVSTGGWSIRRIAGHYFYLRNYQFANYCLTFRVDMEKYLKDTLFDGEVAEKTVYFTDGQTILMAAPDGMDRLTGRNWDSLKESAAGSWLEWFSDRAGCRLLMDGWQEDILDSRILIFWMLLVSVVCIVLLVLFWRVMRLRILQPLRILRDGMKQLEAKEFGYRISSPGKRESIEFCYLYDAFNHMAEEISLSHEKDIKMYQAELDNLRLQVNPHMLLNSFNMIYSLAQVKNYSCIQEFSLYLVEYFRYVLKENDTLVPLCREMKFVESYTGIQKIRFPGAFTSVYSIGDGLSDALVPPLLIQNFVENAMKYALIPGKTIEVLINIRSESDRLLISVCDTGRGIKKEILEKLKSGEVYIDKRGQKHIGIWNCRRRLEVFYGDVAAMKLVSSEGGGTQIWLDLPLQRGERTGDMGASEESRGNEP